MKMNFITNIPKERFNPFAQQHLKNHFLQSYEWGVFKATSPEWDFDTVGLETETGELIAGALVLIRQLPVIKKTFLYIPRGYLIDFNNQNLLEVFTAELKAYAKQKQAIFIKIDPDLKYQGHTPDGEVVEDGVDNRSFISMMESLGYRHLGLTQDFSSTIQPRYTFRLDLTASEKDLLAQCQSKTRYNLKIAQKRGIEIVEGTREDLKTFEAIMRVTGERDGFLTRPLSYFEGMYDALAPHGMCKLYLAKLNTQQALLNTEEELKQTQTTIQSLRESLANPELNEKKHQKLSNKLATEEQKLANLKKQQVELEGLYQTHPTGLVMSGIITTYFGNKAWYLYGASDNLYREWMPNYYIQWVALTEAKANGYEIYDFFGISGKTEESDPLYGLYRFKKGFGGEFTEFVGEFDYVISPAYYQLWTQALPQFKKFKHKLKKK